MIVEHYLRRWQAAGLIDAGKAADILAWERSHARPLAIWALASLGTVAIALGVMAVVGANWEDIGPWQKLGACLLVQVALCGFVWWAQVRDWHWRREIAALLLFGIILAGIALVGQIYQLQSAAWRGLAFWMLLGTVPLAIAARSTFSGLVWGAAAVTTWFAAWDPITTGFAMTFGSGEVRPRLRDSTVVIALMLLLPVHIVAIVAGLRRLWPATRAQGEAMMSVALLAGLAVASAVLSIDLGSRDGDSGLRAIFIVAVSTAIAAALCRATAAGTARWREAGLLAAIFVVWSIGILLAGGPSGALELAIRAAIFVALWSGLAWLAASEGRRGMFALCLTVVGVRLLVVYFEAIGDLTGTGFGLIGGGVLFLILAGVGWQIMQRTRAAAAGAT